MILLQSGSDFFEEWFSQGKSGLESFYSKNLTSLLMAADLTNEDLFDFAFNKNLPLDETGNKVLAIGTDETGKEFLEVKYAGAVQPGLKLNDFYRQFNLNQEQQNKVDSILDSYSDRLASVVLVNDKNTIAVNPELWRYHSRLRQDLLAYASSVNREAVVTAFGGESEFNDLMREPEPMPVPVMPASAENYYFITPDSIFFSRAVVDENRIQNDIARIRKRVKSVSEDDRIRLDLSPVFSEQGELTKSGSMRVMINDNSIRVVIPENISPLEKNRDLEKLASKLDSAFKQLKKKNMEFKFDMPPVAGSEFRVNVRTEGRSGRASYSYGYDAPDMVIIKKDSIKKIKPLDSVFISKQFRETHFPDSMSVEKLQKLADSLSKKFGKDSQWFNNQPDLDQFFRDNFADTSRIFKDRLREEMRQEWLLFRKEMNRLREEMRRFREDLNPQKKKQEAEPIEIRYNIET